MLIVTHPDNVELLRNTLEIQLSRQQDAEAGFIHRMKPMALDLKIQGNPMIEKERHNGRYLVEGNRFFSYWDGEGTPPDWALHFGFVKPIMEPVYYEVAEPTIFTPEWDRKKKYK